MHVTELRISGLDCLKVEGASIANSVAVVLLHGYGANMHDLFPLWKMWHREGFSWYFPNAPLSLPMGYFSGRSWFNIDLEALDRAMRMGHYRELSTTIPSELPDTLNTLETFIGELSQKHSKIILGGFSQGAMCASHLGAKKGVPVDGLILLSGALIAGDIFPQDKKSLPFYQSHGLYDPLLSPQGAKDLETKLLSLGWRGSLHLFSGGHEISEKVIQEVASYLNGPT